MSRTTQPLPRQESLLVQNLSIDLPCYFPSISSVKTNLSLVEYLRILSALDCPQFLLSAYDVAHSLPAEQETLAQLMSGFLERGSFILLDSGNFESYWKQDSAWNQDGLASVLALGFHHLAFSFDLQDTPEPVAAIVDRIERTVLADQQHSSEATVVPIVHASSEVLPEAVFGVAERLHPTMIAVPERELGDGIVARAKALIKLRQALDSIGHYIPLHLLGTGNPLSMAIYSACGADSFDGLEWCQTTVDHETALLHHFQQRELFGEQTAFDSVDVSYTSATLAHNLLFYRSWMEQLQTAIRGGTIADLLDRRFSKRFTQVLRNSLPKVMGL